MPAQLGVHQPADVLKTFGLGNAAEELMLRKRSRRLRQLAALIATAVVLISTGAFVPSPLAANAPPKAAPPRKGAGPVQTQGFLHRVYKDAGGNEARYVLFVPHSYSNKANKLYPVILFLHGSGKTGTDGRKQATVGLGPVVKSREKKFPFFVVFPQAQKPSWLAQTDDAKRAMAILAEVEKKYKIDSKRIYLTGNSMGGRGTWSLAAAYPDKWAAIVPICGRVDPNKGTAIEVDTSKAAVIKSLPCWCFHGSADQTITVKSSREMIAAIRKAGGKPKYTEYPGAGHNIWDRAYRTPDLFRWLLMQHR